MNRYNYMAALVLMLSSFYAVAGQLVTCDNPGENYVGWPTADPIWEMCYLAPADSSAVRGSSLEIRQVHFNGFLVLEKSHVPLLFANYDGSTCYRDWIDTNSQFIPASEEENPATAAITTCDASTSTTQPVGSCPFGLGGGCTTGVEVEKYEDRLVLSTNHSAAWYKYSSRYVFYADGRFQPRFGFGNSDGTNFNTTHYHIAYWRLNFDIDGAENDEVFIVDDQGETQQTVEFSDLREITSGQPNDPNIFSDEVTWLIKDSITGRGYQMVPGFEGTSQDGFIDDYAVGTDPGNDQHHNVDVMVSNYKLLNGGTLPEYSDKPDNYNIGDCALQDENIIDNESLIGIDGNPVIWYRTAVQDLANKGMLCKTGGPMFYPVGDWGLNQAPVAVTDTASVDENSTDNVLDVLANDTDSDGGDQFIDSVTQAANGTVVIGVDGLDVLYTPTTGFCNEGNPTDDFSYTLNGGSSATVAVTVNCLGPSDLIFENDFE